MPNDGDLIKTLGVENQVPKELWADHAAVDIGRNSHFERHAVGSQENLSATEQDEDGSGPIITVHLVISKT